MTVVHCDIVPPFTESQPAYYKEGVVQWKKVLLSSFNV